jgi:hypothetical protein
VLSKTKKFGQRGLVHQLSPWVAFDSCPPAAGPSALPEWPSHREWP